MMEQFSPLALLVAIRRRPLLALAAALLGAVLAGGLVWFLLPDKYTASVLLRVSPVEQRILQDAIVRPVDDHDLYQKTQAALLKSRPVIGAVLKQDKIRALALIRKQSDPAAWLEKELEVELLTNTEIIQMSLSSREHPEDLAVIVNAIQEEYMSQMVKSQQNQQRAVLSDMEKIYELSQGRLNLQRIALRNLSDTKTGDSQILTIKQRNLLEEYAAMRKELLGVQSRLRELQFKGAGQAVKSDTTEAARRLASDEGAGKPDASLIAAANLAVDADPVVQKQQTEVSRLEGVIARMGGGASTSDSPVFSRARNQLAAAKVVLDKICTEKRQVFLARAREARLAERMARSQETEAEMKAIEKVRADLSGEVARLGHEADSIGTSSTEFELRRAEIEQSELVLKSLRNEQERLRVELAATSKSRVSLVAPAEPAEVLKKNARLLETLAASFGGFFLGLFGVSFREFQSRKLYTPADVRLRLGLQVMGTLPDLQVRGGSKLISDQVCVNSVDSLRTMLLQGCPEGASSVLMISSAWSGEGKTTIATHLAGSLARAGRRTLLVDCDLRCPTLHRLFNLAVTPGICNLLTGAIIEETIQPTAFDGLWVLPAGDYSTTAGTALAGGGMQEVFGRLRSDFDFVIVDSGPLLAMPDSLIVGKVADGVVLAVRAGVSQAPQVYAAYECIRKLGLPFVGTVVTGVHDKKLYAHNSRYAAVQANN
jgi:capsular exopolysaccharide synthesis family protein